MAQISSDTPRRAVAILAESTSGSLHAVAACESLRHRNRHQAGTWQACPAATISNSFWLRLRRDRPRTQRRATTYRLGPHRTLSNLPLHHRDPFDRLLISQALTEGLTVVTNDRASLPTTALTSWKSDHAALHPPRRQRPRRSISTTSTPTRSSPSSSSRRWSARGCPRACSTTCASTRRAGPSRTSCSITQVRRRRRTDRGDNFGCGSSREHAPWALLDFGVRCVVAPASRTSSTTIASRTGCCPWPCRGAGAAL